MTGDETEKICTDCGSGVADLNKSAREMPLEMAARAFITSICFSIFLVLLHGNYSPGLLSRTDEFRVLIESRGPLSLWPWNWTFK